MRIVHALSAAMLAAALCLLAPGAPAEGPVSPAGTPGAPTEAPSQEAPPLSLLGAMLDLCRPEPASQALENTRATFRLLLAPAKALTRLVLPEGDPGSDSPPEWFTQAVHFACELLQELIDRCQEPPCAPSPLPAPS